MTDGVTYKIDPVIIKACKNDCGHEPGSHRD